MSTEELEKIKNMWGKARGRTIQIVDRDQMDRLTFELHNKIAAMIAHIDSQAAQGEPFDSALEMLHMKYDIFATERKYFGSFEDKMRYLEEE